jgi:hypothetical protein
MSSTTTTRSPRRAMPRMNCAGKPRNKAGGGVTLADGTTATSDTESTIAAIQPPLLVNTRMRVSAEIEASANSMRRRMSTTGMTVSRYGITPSIHCGTPGTVLGSV